MGAFDSDLDIFLDLRFFGKTAIIDPDGTPRSVNVIFDTAEYTVDGHGPAGINSSKPTITGKTSDLATVPPGTKIQIKGVNYKLKTPGPDEDGFTKLELYKA